MSPDQTKIPINQGDQVLEEAVSSNPTHMPEITQKKVIDCSFGERTTQIGANDDSKTGLHV